MVTENKTELLPINPRTVKVSGEGLGIITAEDRNGEVWIYSRSARQVLAIEDIVNKGSEGETSENNLDMIDITKGRQALEIVRQGSFGKSFCLGVAVRLRKDEWMSRKRVEYDPTDLGIWFRPQDKGSNTN